MVIDQWVYTYSCWNRKKDGERSIKGFNTFSYSKGVTAGEIAELERRCSYNPPFGLPSQPGPEEIAALFPIAFHSFTLASGRKAIVRSNYIGKAFYDGRWGNFISHGLILDSGDWPNYSMEYFDADVFWRDLPDGVKAKALTMDPSKPDFVEPELLPALTEKEIRPTSNFSPENVRRYFEQGGRKGNLAFLIDKLVAMPPGQRPLVFSSRWEEIPWYFAAVTMAFPKHIANEISFVTYLDVPKPLTTASDNWYWLVGAEQRKAHVSINGTDFPETSSSHFPDAIFHNRDAFHEFLSGLGNIQMENIAQAATLFLMLQKGYSPAESELLSLVNFLSGIGKKENFAVLLRCLCQIHSDCRLSLSGIKSLFANIPDDDSISPLLDEFIVAQLRYAELPLIKDVFAEIDIQKRESFYTKCLDCIDAAHIATLGELLIFLIAAAMERCADDITLMSSIELSSRSVNDSNAWNVLLSIIRHSAMRAFPVALHLCPEPKTVQKNCTELFKDINAFISTVNSAIDLGYEELAIEMLVLGNALNNHDDSFFVKCIPAVFMKHKGFTENCLLRIFDKVQFKHISGESIGKYMCLCEQLDDSICGGYLEKLSSLLPIPEKLNSSYEADLKKLIHARENKIKPLHPGRAEFIQWGIKIERNSPAAFEEMERMTEVASSFAESDKCAVADWLLQYLFKYGTTPECHHKNLLFLTSLLAPEIVAKRYTKLAGKASSKNKVGMLDSGVLAFVVCSIKLIPPGQLLTELLTELSFTVFARYEPSAFDALRKQIHELNVLSANEQAAWTQLREQIRSNSKAGFIKRTFTKMIRLFKRR